MPVHGLADPERGVCTCGQFPCGPDNDRAGKHPVQAKWTSLPKASAADAYATFEEDGPDWNIGIRSGEISGVWFLDIDPKAGGDLSLIELINQHGALPDTYTVRTGSGGTHYGFRVPAGVKIKSSQRSKRLPAGIDVRGDGGMVIAAPSVSGIGPYALVDGRDPVDAPAWLLELVVAPEVGDFADSPVVEDLPKHDELDADDQRRVQAYAEAALAREAATYEEAPPGTGNAALFTAACNVMEIVQSPWNTLTTLDAVRALDAARQRRLVAHPGRGQDAEEFRKTFGSAQATVVGKGRPMPGDRRDDLLLNVPPFAGAPAMAGGDEDDPLSLDVPALPPKQSFLDKLRANLLTVDDLLARPNPRPLVNGVLDLDSEAWFIGAPGSFKSFVVLDIAGHVGTGRAWHGRRVHQGQVLYLVAEGVTGMKLRVKAWQSRYGSMENVTFIPFAVQSAIPEQWGALLTIVAEMKPVLIVIDTQARVTVGLEENGATEMGLYVDAVGRLREAAHGACALTVHHTGRNGGDARGSSAIDGAQGTELKVERTSAKAMSCRLLMDKQKDMADTDAIEIEMIKVDQGVDPETGRDLSSLVATEPNPFDLEAVRPSFLNELSGNQAQIAETLLQGTDDRGLTTAEIRTLIKEKYGEMSRNSFNTALAALRKQDIVINGTGGSSHWALKAVVDDPTLALPSIPSEPAELLRRYSDISDQTSSN